MNSYAQKKQAGIYVHEVILIGGEECTLKNQNTRNTEERYVTGIVKNNATEVKKTYKNAWRNKNV